jgi:diacylglycerol kinase family enzyme/membrane-associated phospholipid phosphatase
MRSKCWSGGYRHAVTRLIDKVEELDCKLFDQVARSHTPALDKAMPKLSAAANHSMLWIASSGLLTVLGGRRGKRAALRGLGSLALTSLLVNQVIKRIVRRPRPSLRRVPAVRHLRAQPLTTSFPSGHAASAAAFAVGVSAEYPKAGVPLGALAAAVGYSRTYVGVHYPLDVAVGAAIGGGIAALTRLQWPVLPSDVEERRPASEPIRLEPRHGGEGVTLFVNRQAGNGITGPTADTLRERLPNARIVELEDPSELPERLRAEAAQADVIGICGGDGSTVTAAETAGDEGKPLLLVPAGTLNHLGRDLRVESEDDAITAMERGEAVAIDLGEIDGRPFINTASFGGYTHMLEVRAQLQKRIGRWPAHFAAVAISVFKADPLDIELDGQKRMAWMVFIGNGRHEPSGFAPSWRPDLDDGLLDVRILSGEHPFARTRLLVSILAGRLTRSVAYEQRCVEELEVRSGCESLTLARDGDSFEGSGSFAVRKRRRELVVFAPAREGEA